ncbi:hypothetical protein [Winogradskyella arenosi]|uniref:Preprotein translocase subunit SecB n=1 Tax=Winogradskyella arenosi TaxID=533325 RepID=A0A368ZE32_9FLAO|nr:hypothetical protein [Winogradskyella arenosi]RCW89788.1 hypothetical protein DFQ08_1093 [Winogradskyella arenosi]
MDKENKKLDIDIRYANINVSKFSQFDLKDEFDKESKPLVNFNSNFQFKVFPDKEMITCIVSVNVSIIETGESFCELNVENEFEIKPLAKIVKIEAEDKHNVPTEILRTIVSLSVSTVRGILYEKSKGSIIQGEVYPLINPMSLFEKKN